MVGWLFGHVSEAKWRLRVAAAGVANGSGAPGVVGEPVVTGGACDRAGAHRDRPGRRAIAQHTGHHHFGSAISDGAELSPAGHQTIGAPPEWGLSAANHPVAG
jgi:hypothetical protein